MPEKIFCLGNIWLTLQLPQPTKFSRKKNNRDEIGQWVFLSKDEMPKSIFYLSKYTVDTTLASTYQISGKKQSRRNLFDSG